MTTCTDDRAPVRTALDVSLRPPVLRDGAALWQLARDSRSLDLNSPYAYLMWCGQFASTSVIAEVDGRPAGFVTGFRPPGREDVLFVWQVAVAEEHRGLGLAMRMLESLLDRHPELRAVEATVTPGNTASRRLFRALARRKGCPCSESPHIDAAQFPTSGHEAELLFHVGPIEFGAPRATSPDSIETFDRLESEVRSYVRAFPTVFERAKGSRMIDERGRTFLDFFSGAGALNYGHNAPRLKRRLVEYLEGDGITHSLDMATTAKRAFIERFQRVILEPRGLDYKFLFPGPTGTNAVEAALKLARKATGRTPVYAFRGGFHGMTLGALAITSNRMKRAGAGQPLPHARLLPYDGESEGGLDSLAALRRALSLDAERGSLPAAVVLETVQCEGGVRVAGASWLRGVERVCRAHGVLLIVDDIQAGCGRTGRFFSFEEAGLHPDIVCLSKSLSGMGLPLSLVLLRRPLDVFRPGEHNGTFRGHNPAFVTATAALGYWEDAKLERSIARRSGRLRARLEAMLARFPEVEAELRGRGLVQGIAFRRPELAGLVSRACFERGLVIETAGHRDEVLKFLPALTITEEALDEGLGIVEQSLAAVLSTGAPRPTNP